VGKFNAGGVPRGAVVGELENKDCPKSPSTNSTNSQTIGTFHTVQGFWNYWNNIHVSKLPENSNLKLMKSSVSPQMEDLPCGGKWVINFDKDENVGQKWLMCVLALIGEQLDTTDLCGAVLSIGKRVNLISVWIKTTEKKVIHQIEIDLSQFLDISQEKIKFKRHNASEAKTFTIKLSKSVDIKSGAFPLPSIDFTQTTNKVDFANKNEHSDEDNALCIDLTREPSDSDSPQGESPVASPSRLARSSEVKPNINRMKISPLKTSANSKPSYRPLSPSPSPSQSPLTSPRFLSPNSFQSKKVCFSIGSDAFSKWKNSEENPRSPYALPKFYRRRGKTSKSPQLTPRKSFENNEPEKEEQPNQPIEDTEPSTPIRAKSIPIIVVSPTIIDSVPSTPASIPAPKTKTRSMKTPVSKTVNMVSVSPDGPDSFVMVWRLLLGASALLMIVVVFGVIPALTETQGI